jgi:hypothetical protein
MFTGKTLPKMAPYVHEKSGLARIESLRIQAKRKGVKNDYSITGGMGSSDCSVV